jgi:CRISPR/Cas system-associated protein endoribonuclease Cas2
MADGLAQAWMAVMLMMHNPKQCRKDEKANRGFREHPQSGLQQHYFLSLGHHN